MIFNRFWSNLGVENPPKIVPVGRSCVLRKNLFYLGKTNDFQLWGPPEINDFPARNAHAKQSAPKLEISSIFGPFSGPKSTRKAMRNGACFATLCKPPASRRKPGRTGAFGLSIWLLIWLGLVDFLLLPNQSIPPKYSTWLANQQQKSSQKSHQIYPKIIQNWS